MNRECLIKDKSRGESVAEMTHMEEPQYRFRSNNVEVTVWLVPGDDGPHYEFTVQRRSKDAKSGNWTTSSNLTPHEGLIAGHLLHKAFDHSMVGTPDYHDPS